MNFPFDQVIDQPLVQKIGLTLLHSLWQGLLLAILAGFILLVTRKANSDVRYWLFVGLLGLFSVSVGVTFYRQLDPETGFSAGTTQILPNASSTALASATKPEHVASYLNDGFAFFTQHSSTIVLIWLLMLVLKSGQFLKNLYQLQYLKRNQTFPIGRHWEDQVKALAGKLGISRTIRIRQSGLVKSPLVLGHFKPVILIPLGIITAIPPEEIELMLLHELAHIKRLDFLVNLLQHLLELLFFFNPALMWVSSLIRAEREACCDDLVLSQVGSKRKYIHALLSFREYQLEESGYGLAFAREKGLLQRVERLVLQKNTTLNLSEKVVLLISVILIGTLSFLYAQPVSRPSKSSVSNHQKAGTAPKKAWSRLHSPLPPPKKEGKAIREMAHPDESVDQTEKADHELPIDRLDEIVKADQDQSRPLAADESQTLQPLQDLSGSMAPLAPTLQDSLPELYKKPGLKLNRLSYSPKKLTLSQSIPEQIIDEIVNAGLSPSRDNLSFHITNDFLIVNDVRQSADVHRQIISKFVKKPGDTVDFTYKNTR